MFLPSRPIILPFMSSLGKLTTDTVDSATWSAAYLWIDVLMISLANFSDSSLVLDSISLIIAACSRIVSVLTLSRTMFLASSLVNPATFSNSNSFSSIKDWILSCISSAFFNSESSFLCFFSNDAFFLSKFSSLELSLSSWRLISFNRDLFSRSKSLFILKISSFASTNNSFFLVSASLFASSIILTA